MLLEDAKIKKLPVFTRGGTRLGRVSGFLINTETGEIEKYCVKVRSWINLGVKEILVARIDILEITAEKIIVRDLNLSLQEEVPAEAV